MYTSQHIGFIEQEGFDQFIDSLYAGVSGRPSHFFDSESETICVLSDDHKLLAVCTLFENKAYPAHLILGNYECVDKQEVSAELFKSIGACAQKKGKQFLLGPMNGNTWRAYRYSLLDKKPFLMEQVHQKYYPVQWQKVGFEVCAEYHTNVETILEDSETDTDFFKEKGLQIRSFHKENAAQDFRLIYDLSMLSFKNNLFFTPITWEDFLSMYKTYISLIDESMIDLVFEGDELVGYLFAIENALQPCEIIIKTLARKLDRTYAGMGRALKKRIEAKCKARGYKTLLHAYIHSENYSNMLSHKVGSRLYQKHVLYIKSL